MADNRRENRQAHDAAKAAGLDKPQQDQLQRELEELKSKGDNQATFKEAVQIAQDIKHRSNS